MKHRKIISEQTPSYEQKEASKLKLANEKGCYPSWLKNGQIGKYKGRQCWYGTNSKGNTSIFYADMTAETIKKDGTIVKGKWNCQAITQTAGVTQDTTKISADDQATIETMINDQGWTKTKPVDYDAYPEKYLTYSKISGIILYKPQALKNTAPSQIQNIDKVLKDRGYTLRQPDYGTPEYEISKTNPMTLGSVMTPEEAKSLGVSDLSTNIYKLDASDSGPKNRKDIKQSIDTIKNAPRYSVLECKTNIENLYNNSPTVTKKPRKFTPLTDEYAIEDAKNVVMACISQQGLDGFTIGRGYDAGVFGVSTDDQVRQLIRDRGKYGLKFKYDNWKNSQRTATNENLNIDLKNLIHENLLNLSTNKRKNLLSEQKIIKNRFNIITESYNLKTKKGKNQFSKQLFSELVYLNKQGFNQDLIQEGLFDSIGGLFGNLTGSIFDYFKEYAGKWLLEQFGVDTNSWLAGTIITAVGNINVGDIGKMGDCNFWTKILSKSIAEGTVRYFQGKTVGIGPLQDILRNTLVETLEQTDIGQKLEGTLGTILCPMISKLSGKMETLNDTLKTNALSSNA